MPDFTYGQVIIRGYDVDRNGRPDLLTVSPDGEPVMLVLDANGIQKAYYLSERKIISEETLP